MAEKAYLEEHQQTIEQAMGHAVSAAVAARAADPVRFVSEQLKAQADAEGIVRAADDIDLEFRALDGGCKIELTEERAISLVQLEAVWANIERRCEKEKWEGGRPDGTDAEGKVKWKTVALTPESVNLYDADKYLIKPVTVARRCSLVEVLAAGPQPPDWFVSHFWGEPIKEFVACIKRHSADRLLGFDMKGKPAQPVVHTNDFPRFEYEVKAPGLYWVRSAALPSPPLHCRTRLAPILLSPSAGLRVRQQPVGPGGVRDGRPRRDLLLQGDPPVARHGVGRRRAGPVLHARVVSVRVLHHAREGGPRLQVRRLHSARAHAPASRHAQ